MVITGITVTAVEAEERLDLVALDAELVELALHAALGQEAGAGADAHLLMMPLDVADGDEGKGAAVLALHAERSAVRAALDAAVGLAQPALAQRRARRDAESGGRVEAADHLGERH